MKNALKNKLSPLEIYTVLSTSFIFTSIYLNTITVFGINNNIILGILMLIMFLTITILPTLFVQLLAVIITPFLIKCAQVMVCLNENNETSFGKFIIRYNLSHFEKTQFCSQKCKELNYAPTPEDLLALKNTNTLQEIHLLVDSWHTLFLQKKQRNGISLVIQMLIQILLGQAGV